MPARGLQWVKTDKAGHGARGRFLNQFSKRAKYAHDGSVILNAYKPSTYRIRYSFRCQYSSAQLSSVESNPRTKTDGKAAVKEDTMAAPSKIYNPNIEIAAIL